MIKNPIQEVTNKLQYRAIGIVEGIYKPNDIDQLNRGKLIDQEGKIIETVILGKALSLIKKYINLEKNYFWIVYPRNKSTSKLHLQVAGIWDPYKLNDFPNNSSKTNFSKLLEELELEDNYFSVRGELVFVNTQKKEIVIKICSDSKLKNLKNKNFKLVIKGELSLQLLNCFVSLDIKRHGNALKLISYEVIEKDLSENN